MLRTGTSKVTIGLLALALAVLPPMAVGCQRGEAPPPEEAPTEVQRPRGPDRQVFAPLVYILESSSVQLPFLLENDEEVVSVPCFQPVGDLIAADVTSDIAEPMKQQQHAVSKVLRQWVRDEVSPSAVNDSAIDSWTISPEEVASVEIDDTAIRFAEEEECVDSSTGWMRRDVRVVAGLFGAKSFRFTAKTPIARNIAEKLIEEFNAAGFPTKTEDLEDYELVTDDDGQPRKGDDGAKLYRHPDLGVVSENDITPPHQQRMKTWTVESERPVFFAYRELAKVASRRESAADECNVNVVWQDPAYREPDCPQLSGTGFKAARRVGGVQVQMKNGDDVQTFELQFDKVKRVRLSDRIILWISPVNIEEGALIRTNSLVLGR